MGEDISRIGKVETEVIITASTTRVWRALTDEIDAWWPAEFYSGGVAGRRHFRLEATPGGRMFETWEEGGGTLWGTVVCADPGKILQVVGNQFPNWGGPAQWYGSWSLSPAGEDCRLTFSETVVGRVNAASLAEKEAGWRFLLAVLKAHVEGTPAPAWGSV